MLTLGNGLVERALGEGLTRSAFTCVVPPSEVERATVFSSFLHMHGAGKRIWSEQWRGGAKVAETSRNDFWDEGFQVINPANNVLLPGDELHTTCIHQTADASRKFGLLFLVYTSPYTRHVPIYVYITSHQNHLPLPPPTGPSREDEMCYELLTYWPKMPMGNCEEGARGSLESVSVLDFDVADFGVLSERCRGEAAVENAAAPPAGILGVVFMITLGCLVV